MVSAKRFSGCRGGILSGTILISSICLLNVIVTILVRMKGTPKPDSMWRIFYGDCAAAKTRGTWIHLIINVFSSAMLGASNYAMQVAASPDRKQVDKAHAANKSLDIGVPSIKNIAAIRPVRQAIFMALLLSSLPLHFLYNSAVFSSTGAYEYKYWAVSSSFLTDAPTARNNTAMDPTNYLRKLKQNKNYLRQPWHNLTAADCLTAYRADFSTSRRNVVVVLRRNQKEGKIYEAGTALMSKGNTTQGNWICNGVVMEGSEKCDPLFLLPERWTVQTGTWEDPVSTRVDYCLSESVPEHCDLQFSQTIMIIVCICNLIKAIAMLALLISLNDRPFVTLGDAMASFLQRADEYVGGDCLLAFELLRPGKPFSAEARHWHKAVSGWRRFTTNTTYALAWMALEVMIPLALSNDSNYASVSLPAIWKRGIGAVNGISLVNMGQKPSLLSLVLLANIPQFVISTLYFAVNSNMTSMLLGKEWNSFSREHRPLRTTIPEGEQFSTYWLGLPYQWGIPLIVLSSILHWLASQSLFVAQVSLTDLSGALQENTILALGYSLLGSGSLLIIGTLLWIAFNAIGIFKYGDGLPPIRNDSIRIAATCHTTDEGGMMHLKKIRWGEKVVKEVPLEKRHLEFSQFEVKTPEEGVEYK